MTGRTMAQANITGQLAHHDNLIHGLSSRIGHVEKTLSDHGTVLQEIRIAVTRTDAQPKMDFHKLVTSIVSIAALFGMVCGGIIYIATKEFGGLISEQKSFNQGISRRVDRHETQIDQINIWRTTVVRNGK
jgi:hypothetical protein